MNWTTSCAVGRCIMIFERPESIKQAACRGMDPDLYMPERGGQLDVQQAVQGCAGFPVRLERAS